MNKWVSGILFWALGIVQIIVYTETTKSKIFWSLVLIFGFLLLPGKAKVVAPVVVFIGIFIQSKLGGLR